MKKAAAVLLTGAFWPSAALRSRAGAVAIRPTRPPPRGIVLQAIVAPAAERWSP
jgi:hypothetical protein